MARNLLTPRKHYVSAYANDICISHKGYDDLDRALTEFARQKERAISNAAERAVASFNMREFNEEENGAPDHVVFWKGTRKKPFAEYTAEKLVFDGVRFVPRETMGLAR